MAYQDDDTEDSSGGGDDSSSDQSDSSGQDSSAQDTSSDIQLPPGTDISAPDDMTQVAAPPQESQPADNPNYDAPDSGQADDSTAHVDYHPDDPPQPVMRAPDGTEQPLSDGDRPEEGHDVEDDTTVRSSQGEGNTDAEGAP